MIKQIKYPVSLLLSACNTHECLAHQSEILVLYWVDILTLVRLNLDIYRLKKTV